MSAFVKKKIGSLALLIGLLAQVEPHFRVLPKIALGGIFAWFRVKIKQNSKSTTEITRRATDLIFFLNEAQWGDFPGKIPKNQVWALSGAILGLLVWAAVWKWVWEAEKAKKAECVGMGMWGVKIGQKPKKSFFSEKPKWVLSFKKKIGSLALLVGLLA